MHIAFLTTEYPNQSVKAYGGLATSIKSAARGLLKLNMKVSVFVMSHNENRIMNDEGITVHFIAQRKYKFASWFYYKKHVQRYINTQIRKEDIRAIEAPDWSGISAFMRFDCPLVIRFHGSDAYFCQLEGRPQKTKNFWLEKIALRSADHFISVSEFTAEITKRIFNLKNRIIIIPNGVDIDYFQPVPPAEEENRILYFGTLIRKKGVLDLMDAFNRLLDHGSEAQLYLAGADVKDIKTGRSTQALMQEKLSLKAKKKVHFLGKINYEKVREEIAKATVITLPSHAEAMPMTWLESMAMEKAMLTSNIGWAQEVMIDGQTGYTVTPTDHSEFACKLWRLLNNAEMRKKFGIAARDRVVHHFSTEKVAKQNFDFYYGIGAP